MTSVNLGAGTYLASGATINPDVVTPDGYSLYNISETIDGVNYAQVVSTEADMLANNKFVVTVSGVDTYYDITFAEALTLVSDGGTIKLLADATYTVGSHQKISKGMTIDLGGKTLHIVQTAANSCAAFYISTTSQFAIKNGYLTVESTQETETANVGKVYPIIVNNIANADIVITDVHATVGGFVQNPGNTFMTLTVTGGSYRGITPVSHTNGTFVESRANCSVTVTGTSFYLDATQLIASLSYKVTAGSECNSEFTFTDCEIYRSSASSSAIKYMNNYTWLTFNNCKIHASLTGTRHDWDTNQTAAVSNNVAEPTSANIILGEGTVIADGATANAVVASGLSLVYNPTEVTFAPAGATYTATVRVGSAENAEYKLTLGGIDVLVEKSTMTLAEAIANADSGTTLYILLDISVITPADAATTENVYATINKPLVIDLCGNTLYFSQSVKDYSVIQITTTSGVEIKNGTIVHNVNANYTTGSTPPELSSGPLFSVSVDNASLTFTDINGYGGTLVYSYQRTGLTINFVRGEYHVNKSMDLIGGGLVETRANTTLNMEGTTVVLASDVPLFTLASYKETGTRSSSATLTDCTILGASESANVLISLNNYGRVQFNNCMIYGSINPSVNGTDALNGGDTQPITDPVAGSVVLGDGTYISANSTLKADVVVAETDRAIVEANKSYTFTLTFASGTIYDTENPTFTLATSNEIYTFGLVVGEPPLKNLTVTWYKEDGKTVIIVQTILEGTVGVVAPTYTPGDNNGWYKTGFDGWTTVNGSSDKVDLASYVVSDNVAFYPAVKLDSTPTAYLSGAEYNLTLTGNITLNFYLPSTPDGVTVLGVYDESGNLIPYNGVILPNGQYRRLYVVNTVGATALTTASKLKVIFTVLHNGETVELTQNITISPYKYAKGILEDSAKDTPTYSSATHTLIADMVRYSNILSNTVTGSTITELDELLATYGDLCSTLPYDNGFAEYTTSITDLLGYIKSISFEVSSYQPKWVFTFDASKKIVDVKITIDGYYELPDENGYNFGEITYEIDPETSTYSGNYITTAYTQSVPMYNIDRVMTITVTTEDGTVKSGTYSLNNYYANVSATGDELLAVREFLQAFRAFGETSSGYRYAGGIKQAGKATTDFFKCSHTNLGSWTVASGRYCSDCMTYIFSYEDYITNGGKGGMAYTSRDDAYNGKENSYSAIDYCHAMANAFYNNGNKVGCVAGSKFYYFGESLDYSGNISEITVQTDTDWAGAYFVVDDEPFDITDASYKTVVFGIRGPSAVAPDGTSLSSNGTDITTAIATALGTAEDTVILSPDTTNIGWSCGMPMLVSLIDYSQSRYHREGANASKASSREVILIDEFGNVNPTTPIEWDYVYDTDWYGATPETASNDSPTYVTGSFRATAYPISASPIKISGLDDDGNISFTFENVANNNITATSYSGCGRGIQVRGANITLEGMEHIMTEDDDNTTPRQAYSGFIRTYLAHNTVIKDMLVMNHLGHYVQDENGNNTTNSLGSYEFGGSDSTYTSWINCKTKNLFWEDGSVTYRGMFGTNRMRNNYLKDCVLNSYDAHSGAYNTTIEDCTFEHINFVGQGDIILKNVVIYADSGAGGIHLRQDYGSRWEGNIYIDGLDLRHSTDYTLTYVDLVKAYYTNWDFGYTDKTETSGNYLPFYIYANNVTVSTYSPVTHEYNTANNYTCTNGGIVDETTAVSNLPLGIYINYDNTLKSKSYDSSSDANQQTPTTAIYFTGGTIESLANLCIPNNAYFEDMKIYIDGTEQSTWYSTCNGVHTDSNGDWYCESCTARINCTASHSGNSSGKCSTCGATIKDTGSCVTGDTLVTLADGTTARIDSLKDGDMILAWNFETGCVEAVPVAKWVNHGYDNNTVIVLSFEDGTTVKVVNAHQFFSVEANDFVTIELDTVGSYVGKSFAAIDANGEIVTKKLTSYEYYTEYIEAYATVSAYHYNIFVEGMLTMDFKERDLGLFRGFEIGADMKYDEEKMIEDIENYGLYTYEEFADYISEETFELFNFKYMKVAVGKGYSSYEHIVTLIKRYGLN